MIKIAQRYGLIMMGGFIAFFLSMYAIGLAQNYWLRLFFVVIHLGVLSLSINAYRRDELNGGTNPKQSVKGVAHGMATSFIGVLGFCIFLFLFLTLDSNLMSEINAQFSVSRGFNPVTAAAFMFVEGIAAGLIGSYVLTRIVDSKLEAIA
ncbi:MAG: hypothetical protein Sapg2KO_21050 [Saprospiraceae bacterium]